MSLSDAKRALQWSVVMEAMASAGVDAETIALVESARQCHVIVQTMTYVLLGATAFQRESARYHKWYSEDWQRQIEAGSRIQYTPMLGMSILDDI